MTITLTLADAGIGAPDGSVSYDFVPGLRLEATMKFYALGRLYGGSVPASPGNGRVEFLSRLTKFGGNLLGQYPQGVGHSPMRSVSA